MPTHPKSTRPNGPGGRGAPDGFPRRVVIENVRPEVDGGRFPVKRTIGETVTVEADIFADGHDRLSAVLRYRREEEPGWNETSMIETGNDRWAGSFRTEAVGRCVYGIEAWIDRFKTWRRNLDKKVEAGQEVRIDLLAGAEIVEAAGRRAGRAEGETLLSLAKAISAARDDDEGVLIARGEELGRLMDRHPDRSRSTVYEKELHVVVDREKARFSAWYELFPRSVAPATGGHGTLGDVQGLLPYVASMGFDVLYLPPIHPIGRTNRKGKGNAPAGGPEDPGSPWAIGSAEGGHKSVHPALGTLDDFRSLVEMARAHGIEVALDLAFQCSPDHPYVREHPEWFRARPDGTIQYAENPPKKYEDIFPLDFDTGQWRELWEELKSVVLFWIDREVRIFRVDNPHTKPFPFWEWLIGEVKRERPDVLFLSEAFTRPKVMYRLAKLGFTQSYTYFAWRNSKREIVDYFHEIARTDVAEYFRPNLWPNTPDILTEYLQFGGRPAFMARFVLAATLGASYGIYGPAFELCEARPHAPGSEEYLESEKYEIVRWDLNRPDSLREFIALVNRIRRENPCLHGDRTLRFLPVDNDQLIAYSKSTEDLSNIVVSVVNLDPRHTQSGWVTLPLGEFGLDPRQPYQGHDLLSGARYLWHGERIYVELNPSDAPAHLLRIRRRVRTERDFDYFL